MAGTSTPASKTVVIDLVVLAFFHSRVREVVGTDALRTVLEIRYRDMVSGGSLDLEPLWALLVDQPGFDAADATPALCRVKTWEERIGRPVTLPPALAGTDEATIREWASEVKVPEDEIEAVFSADAAAAERAPPGPTRRMGAQPKTTQSAAAKAPKDSKKAASRRGERKLGWEVPLVIVAILGFVIGGYSIYGYACSEPAFEAAKADFNPIPVRDVRKLGDEVGATLSDPQWRSLPKEERAEQVKAVLERVSSTGSAVAIFIVDDKGTVIASARTEGGNVRIQFPAEP